ncbi:MAG: IPT/TIG domain-containing protein [Anaerolineales bacterium]|nr:IPT/TIG domain-containing protein [Anaerolineales bacterium]MCX7754509.1 IPT/TIG domain-containing protein [Anaerolineales bacterium]MDW8277131.1 IPT/TIG domain-containing protein [Anaerolineales bacterium]
MKLEIKPFSLVAIFFVLISSLALPGPAYALDITGISPAAVPGGVVSTVTITGSGFESDVVVTLSGYSNPLVITSWSTTQLTVLVPADVPAGVYTITASSLLSPPADSFSSLTVLAAPPPTNTPIPTATPQPTATPGPFGRPQLAVKSYRTSVGEIRYGQDFNLIVRMENAGQYRAYNAQAVFTSADLVPLKTGGVAVIGDVDSGVSFDVGQAMRPGAPLFGKTNVIVEMTVTYYDEKATQYTEKFVLTVPVVAANYVPANTPTPTGVTRSQLVITAYQTDVQPLQPGVQFTLGLTIQNMGNANAKGVTMIVGGGSAGAGGSSGTPQPGGVSGGSGEFTNFAPVGSSNIQSLGDIPPGGTFRAEQKLIVNVSTNPGAYPLKITLSYTDARNNVINDEQVITLLVYQLPVVEVSFYQPVFSLTAGMPNPLPLQISNLGKKSAVLGSMKISASNGMVENSTTLVGNIEPGGFFTFDSTVTPDMPGALELTVTIEYTDDFNQPRTIVKTLTLDVLEMPMEPTPDPNMPGGGEYPLPGGEETFWQKAWRFLLGLFGLDSGTPQQQPIQPPSEEPLPAPGGGFKGG